MKPLFVRMLLVLLFASSIACENDSTIGSEYLEALTPDATNARYNLWDKAKAVAPRYDGSDSGPIDRTIAQSWIENFKKTNGGANAVSHYFSKQALEQLLSQEGCTGIRFHYALDEYKEKKLIITAASYNGGFVASDAPSYMVDGHGKKSSTAGRTTPSTAQAWIRNYTSNITKDEIRSHYFGRNMIERLLGQPGCEGIHVYHALSNLNEKKLILIGAQEQSGATSHIIGDTVNDITDLIGDFSFPCPSVCPPKDPDDDENK